MEILWNLARRACQIIASHLSDYDSWIRKKLQLSSFHFFCHRCSKVYGVLEAVRTQQLIELIVNTLPFGSYWQDFARIWLPVGEHGPKNKWHLSNFKRSTSSCGSELVLVPLVPFKVVKLSILTLAAGKSWISTWWRIGCPRWSLIIFPNENLQ